jgi:hypothetical protein
MGLPAGLSTVRGSFGSSGKLVVHDTQFTIWLALRLSDLGETTQRVLRASHPHGAAGVPWGSRPKPYLSVAASRCR